jgi:hypothetical protein
MYNTAFKVKYRDIELELLTKLTSVNTEASADHQCDYTTEDIHVVCDKLYRDELTSVFNADDILDDKIDEGMKLVLAKLVENDRCNEWVAELKHELSQSHHLDNNLEQQTLDQNLEQQTFDQQVDTEIYILLILFSKSIFYITHKCICQQFNEGKIDDYLFNEWKSTVAHFQSN